MKLRFIALIIVAGTLINCPLVYSQGDQHIRITGSESLIQALPGWTSFSSTQTLSIPSLQADDFVFTVEWTSPGTISYDQGPFGGFKGFGTGLIRDDLGEPVGNLTFYYMGQSLGPPLVFEYIGEIKAVGTFFAGPFEGLMITENIVMWGVVEIIVPPGIPTYPEYTGQIEGFLTVPEFVDFQALKASFKD